MSANKQEIKTKDNTITMVWNNNGKVYVKGILLDKEEYLPKQLYMLNQTLVRTLRKTGNMKIKSHLDCNMDGTINHISFFNKEGRCMFCDKEMSQSREMTGALCKECEKEEVKV